MTIKSRKMVLKLLAIFMAVCTLIQLGSVSFAEGVQKTNGRLTEIIIKDDVDSQKVKLITDFIEGKEVVTPRGIFCIFGHNLVETMIIIIEHGKYPTAPRCLESTYKVFYCSRSSCDYIEMTLIGQRAIFCCP